MTCYISYCLNYGGYWTCPDYRFPGGLFSVRHQGRMDYCRRAVVGTRPILCRKTLQAGHLNFFEKQAGLHCRFAASRLPITLVTCYTTAHQRAGSRTTYLYETAVKLRFLRTVSRSSEAAQPVIHQVRRIIGDSSFTKPHPLTIHH